MSLHSPLKAARAASTALSTSSGSAAWTEQISDSSVGFMEVILLPLDEATNSLLMNRPVGCVYDTPFGAVSLTDRSDIVVIVLKLDGLGVGLIESICRDEREKRERVWESIYQNIRPTCTSYP